MHRHQADVEAARLQARVPVKVHDQLRRAARLRGITLTGHIIATAGADARRVVEGADTLPMAREDQDRFAEALIDPVGPNRRLARADRRHAEMVQP